MLKITAQKTGFSVTDFYSKCDWCTGESGQICWQNPENWTLTLQKFILLFASMIATQK